MSTCVPFTASLVIRMPSVFSAGTDGAARGASPRKMFWSSRIWIDDSAESLLLCSTIVSRPERVEFV